MLNVIIKYLCGNIFSIGESWFIHGLKSWLLPKCNVPAHDVFGVQYESVDVFYDLIDYHLPDASVLEKKINL